MTMFLVCGLIFTLVIGSLFGIMIFCNMDSRHRLLNVVLAIAISLVVGFTISGLFTIQMNKSIADWNDGVCPKCGTEWRFVNADYEKYHGTVYYYVCDDCGKIIEQKH